MQGGKTSMEGRYVYCVAKHGEKASFGNIGIEGSEVYSILNGNLCVLVHDCEAKAYESDDEEKVKEWVRTHNRIIEMAEAMFGAVVPVSFDVIITGKNPGEEVDNWLQTERGRLEGNLEKVKGKKEFGAQVIWDPEVIGKKLARENGEIKKLAREMERAPKGKAYFIRQKVQKALKRELEGLADGKFKSFYSKIKKHCCDIKVEKNKKIPERQMLMNLSCLVEKDRAKELGAELGRINRLRGFEVRFTGPWPPYSFIT